MFGITSTQYMGIKQANTFANFMIGSGISYAIGKIAAVLGGHGVK